MSSQWGRNNQVTRSGGSPRLLIAAILCLALIGAGTYFWFARQAMQTEIAALTTQLGVLGDELKTAVSERDKAKTDLTEFRKNSGNWAGEIEQEYADLKLNEIPKLNRLLDKRDADISTLEKLLSTEKTAAKSAAADFTATISAINAELKAARDEAIDAGKKIEARDADKLALSKQVASLNSALERATADTLAARKALQQNQAEAAKPPPTFKSALDLARDVQVRTLEQSLDEERRTVAALQKQLADQAASDSVPEAKPAETPAVSTSADEDESPQGTGLMPRDGLLVENVVGATRGLGLLDAEKTERLKDKLVAGACVTDALESVFDRVPLVLMRNLMRDLKSDC